MANEWKCMIWQFLFHIFDNGFQYVGLTVAYVALVPDAVCHFTNNLLFCHSMANIYMGCFAWACLPWIVHAHIGWLNWLLLFCGCCCVCSTSPRQAQYHKLYNCVCVWFLFWYEWRGVLWWAPRLIQEGCYIHFSIDMAQCDFTTPQSFDCDNVRAICN